MKLRSVLLAVGCWLSAVSGQWVEKTIVLPDSLSGLLSPGPMLYNPGNNTLFIGGTNGLAVVDGISNRVVARTLTSDLSFGAACYASQVNKVYWTAGGAVWSFDGANGRVLARVGVQGSYDICYNPVVNRAYAMGWNESSFLAVINAADDSVVRTMTVGGKWEATVCCNPDDNKVYIGLSDAGVVLVIDCSVDSVRRSISVGSAAFCLAYNRVGGKLYCSGYRDTLTVIDGRSDSIIGRVVLTGQPRQIAYNPAANKLYCADEYGVDIICGYGDTLLARVEPSRRVTAFAFDSTDNLMWCTLASSDTLVAIDGQGDTLCGEVATGSIPNGICYNPARNRLYASQNQLVVIDPAARRMEQRTLLCFTPAALCWAKSASKIYCAGLNEATVAVINSQQSSLLRLVPVGQEPRALVHDRPLGLVCCANHGDSTVSLITCNGDSVTGTVRIGHEPELLGVDTVLHKAWCRFNDGIAVIDLRAESLEAVIPVSGQETLLVDPPRGRVYCATGSDAHVVAFDAAGDSAIANIPVGGTAYALCLIPNANLICCATRSNDAVAVIDGATNRVVNIIPVSHYPHALLYNPQRNKLYCTNYDAHLVTVIACSTWTPVAVLDVGSPPTSLAYDSVGDRVYCVCPYGNVVDVVDCRRDTVVACVQVGDYPVDIVHAHTAVQHRMFVANENGSSLSVIRDTGRAGVVEEGMKDEGGRMNVGPTVVRGELVLGAVGSRQNTGYRADMLDISGRRVLELHPGVNDVRRLAPGVYFVRAVSRELSAVSCQKVVLTR